MNSILITSGGTREYLDPVRYLTNSSSGRMGAALAEAVLRQGVQPVVVSGHVSVCYPAGTKVFYAVTTDDMLRHCLNLFPKCIGVIGAAAPCDFRPAEFSEQKIAKSKNGSGIMLRLEETDDILAALGKIKQPDQWSTAFALETEKGHAKAMKKLKQKNCNFVVLNRPDVIDSEEGTFQVFNEQGKLQLRFSGTKRIFADKLLQIVCSSLTVIDSANPSCPD